MKYELNWEMIKKLILHIIGYKKIIQVIIIFVSVFVIARVSIDTSHGINKRL